MVNLGMQITAELPSKGMIEGFLPIAQLPTAVKVPQTVGIDPMYTPFTRLGSAPNEADPVLKADIARSTYNVNGTGVKVGVLSDSVNQYDNPAVPGVGLAESYTTGDIPQNSVQVLQDLAGGGGSDEGRAMIEQIADIAPGSTYAFHTAFGGQVTFANGIRALAQAGSKVIVDDVGNLLEPFFQDGPIDDAIRDVVTNFDAATSRRRAIRRTRVSVELPGCERQRGRGSGRAGTGLRPGPGRCRSRCRSRPGSAAARWSCSGTTRLTGVTSDLDLFAAGRQWRDRGSVDHQQHRDSGPWHRGGDDSGDGDAGGDSGRRLEARM